MKYVLIFYLFFISLTYSQVQQTDCAKSIFINQSVNNFRTLQYPQNTKARKINSFEEVKNSTPEELISSSLSATNLHWFNFNREDKKKKSSQDFNYIKNVNSDLYFAELLFKIEFEANGKEYAIVKYHLHDNNKSELGFAEVMTKKDGRWYTISESEVSQLLFFMIMIDVKYINQIFNDGYSDNSDLNKILVDNKSNDDSIDINNVLFLLEKELSNDNENIKAILDPKRIFK